MYNHTLHSNEIYGIMPKKLNLDELLIRAHETHNNKYDYSLIREYKGTMIKYPIICDIHGIWEVTLDNHVLKKSGCPKCKGFKLSNDDRIKIAHKIHNNKYDYSLINGEIKSKDKYNFICLTCSNHFKNSWDNHINKHQGCRKCNPSGRKKRTLDSLIEQINNLKTGYEYDWNSYIGYFDNNFRMKCPTHGWFTQQLSNHISGNRCQKCRRSKGEDEIEYFLKNNNIIYETQKRFKDCKNIKQLPFDFYIPSKNLCIEYDGELHTKSVKFFGGDESLEKTINNDNIKNQFCLENNINLLRISYINFIFKIDI